MSPGRRRAGGVAAGVLGLGVMLGLGGLTWQLWSGHPAGTWSGIAPAAGPPRPAAAGPSAHAKAGGPGAPATLSEEGPAPADEGRLPSWEELLGGRDACDRAIASLSTVMDSEDGATMHPASAKSRRSWRGLLQRLDASPSAAAHGVSMWLQLRGAAPDGPNLPGIEQQQALTEQLMELARTQPDALLQSLSQSACAEGRWATGQRPAACRDWRPDRWAALEPGNGQPWLTTPPAVGEAPDEWLAHLAQAERFDSGWGRATGAVGLQFPQDGSGGAPTLATRAWAQVLVLGMEAAEPAMTWVGPLRQACGLAPGAAPATGERQTVCVRVAQTLATHSDTLLVTMTGQRMLQGLSPDPARDRDWARDQARLNAALQADIPQPGCHGQRQLVQHLDELAARGEMALLRRKAGLD